MRLITALALFLVLVVGACAPENHAASYYSRPHSDPFEELRQDNIVKSQYEAEIARKAIVSKAKVPLSIANGESMVRQLLRDPESARFRDVQRNTATGAVCGFVNAKNAYGGYSGETPFIYFYADGKSSPQLLMSDDVTTTATLPYMSAFCPSDGTTVPTDAPASGPKARHRS